MQDLLWYSRHQHALTTLQSEKDPNPGSKSMNVCNITNKATQGNNGDIKDSNLAVKGFQAMADSKGQDCNSNTMVATDEGLLSKDDLVRIARSISLQEMEAHGQLTFTTTIMKDH